MGWAITLGGLSALFLIICLIRVGVTVELDTVVSLDIHIGPFRIHIDPSQPSGKKTEEKKKEFDAKALKRFTKTFPRPTLQEIKDAIAYFAPVLRRTLERTRRSVRIHPLQLFVKIGGAEDPAAMAELYGYANAAVWTWMPKLEQLLVIPDPQIHLELDFDGVKTVFQGKIGVSIMIGDLFLIGLGAGIPAVKWFLKFKKTHKLSQIKQEA